MEIEEGFEMWEVDVDAIAALGDNFQLKLFCHLWKTMDDQTQQVLVELPPKLTNGVHRQTIWKAFTRLEEMGYLRRPRNSRSWSVVFICPQVVHPYWVKGQKLNIAMKQFNGEPTIKVGLGLKNPFELTPEEQEFQRELKEWRNAKMASTKKGPASVKEEPSSGGGEEADQGRS